MLHLTTEHLCCWKNKIPAACLAVPKEPLRITHFYLLPNYKSGAELQMLIGDNRRVCALIGQRFC
jgi:hypothetical protein